MLDDSPDYDNDPNLILIEVPPSGRITLNDLQAQMAAKEPPFHVNFAQGGRLWVARDWTFVPASISFDCVLMADDSVVRTFVASGPRDSDNSTGGQL